MAHRLLKKKEATNSLRRVIYISNDLQGFFFLSFVIWKTKTKFTRKLKNINCYLLILFIAGNEQCNFFFLIRRTVQKINKKTNVTTNLCVKIEYYLNSKFSFFSLLCVRLIFRIVQLAMELTLPRGNNRVISMFR